MACPHVSGVVALGLSYAAQLRRHFTEAEMRELLCSTTAPIDEFQTGTKTYTRYVADIGPIQPMQINLNAYRGQMGTGQVDAGALLAAIEGAGRQMSFPNLYVAEGSSVAVVPSRYFEGGEELTYNVSINNSAVATVKSDGAKLIFCGVAEGVTSAKITASNGESFAFNITVRKKAVSG